MILVRTSWALSYVIHVISIHDVLYCDVFVGRLGWQIIRAIVASLITPGMFHESRQVLSSRDADYDSLLWSVNTKKPLASA